MSALQGSPEAISKGSSHFRGTEIWIMTSNSPLLDNRDVLVSSPKPPSLRSVNSTSSVASGTSLSRRPRIRDRSRTLTGGTAPPSGLDDPLQASSPPSLFTDRPVVDAEPAELSESTIDTMPTAPTSSTLHLIRPPPRAVRIRVVFTVYLMLNIVFRFQQVRLVQPLSLQHSLVYLLCRKSTQTQTSETRCLPRIQSQPCIPNHPVLPSPLLPSTPSPTIFQKAPSCRLQKRAPPLNTMATTSHTDSACSSTIPTSSLLLTLDPIYLFLHQSSHKCRRRSLQQASCSIISKSVAEPGLNQNQAAHPVSGTSQMFLRSGRPQTSRLSKGAAIYFTIRLQEYPHNNRVNLPVELSSYARKCQISLPLRSSLNRT